MGLKRPDRIQLHLFTFSALLIILLTLSNDAFCFSVKTFRIAFLTGVRFSDGFGDLSLNKYFMDEQIDELRRRYGDAIEVHVVYLNEIRDSRNNLTGLDGVRRIYQEEEHVQALRELEKMGQIQVSVGQPYVNRETGIRYWTENGFRRFTESHTGEIDLALMVSETSKTMRFDKMYHLPSWVGDHMNVIAFREYSSQIAARRVSKVEIDSMRSSDKLQNFFAAKVITGPLLTGIIAPIKTRHAQKMDLLELIRRDVLNFEDRFVPLLDQESAGLSVLESNPWIVPSFLSRKPSLDGAEERAFRSVLLAFHHSELPKADPARGYVVFSNSFPASLSVESLVSNVSGIELQERFRQFVKKKLLILKAGSKPLTTTEVRGLFHPENGALFVQASGYGALADALSVGVMPMMQWRSYHEDVADDFSKLIFEIIAVKYGKDIARKTTSYLNTPIGKLSKDFDKFVAESVEFSPILLYVADEIRHKHSLSAYFNDTVDVFIRAKQMNPDHLLEAIASELRKPEPSGNRFLSDLKGTDLRTSCGEILLPDRRP